MDAARAKAFRRLFAETAVWLVIAIGMWVYSYASDARTDLYAWGPMGWPRAVLLIIFVSAAASFALTLRQIRHATAPDEYVDSEIAEGGHTGLHANLKIFGTFALPLLYLWLLPRTGYFVTTPFFLAGYMYVFGQRRKRHLIGTALAIHLVLILVFSKWLFVPLPTGNWPGFYDLSNALLVFLRSF